MSKCVLVNVINRMIYVEQYNSVNEAWTEIENEFCRFCEDNDLSIGYDCAISYNTLSAWANGSYDCIDWMIHRID